MQRSNALRVVADDFLPGRHSISSFKTAPRHFEFDISLKEQAERLQDDHKLSNEAIAPTLGFIASREWSPSSLPTGADAWVVAADSYAISDDYETATCLSMRRLLLRASLSLTNEISILGHKPHRNERTARAMAMVRQVQPRSPLLVMAVNLGFSDRYSCFSQEQAEAQFAPGEFALGDPEFSSIFSNHPGCLESSNDRGLLIGGTYYGEEIVGYSVRGHRLLRQLKSVREIDHGFRVATGFLFK